jgi:hypothetical protein
MKLIMIFGSLLFLTLVVVQNSHDASAQSTSYPLMCRSGGSMRVSLLPDGVDITFTGGTQAAGTRPPQPGECTWLDRGFVPNEPRRIRWTNPQLNSLSVTFRVDGTTRTITEVTIAGNASPQYAYLNAKIRTGEVFQFHANCGSPSFCVATRVGP